MLFPAILWGSGISWGNLGVIFCDFVGFPGFPGRAWVLFSAFLYGFFRDFLGEPVCYFLRFCRVSGISWENLGGIFCDFVGFPGWEAVGDGPGRAARVSSGQSGWRVARYFDPQFLNFCRRRRRPLWPAGLPRFKV